MTNKITAMITICLLAVSAFAQSYDLEWGEAKEAGNSNAAYVPIGFHNGFFYTVQFSKGDGMLIKVDANNNIVSQKELVTAEKKFETEFVFKQGDNIVFLNSDYDGKTKVITVTASQFTFEGKLVSVKPKTLTKFQVAKNRENTDLQYFLSPDSSKLLILHDHNMPNKENAKISFGVVNTSDLKEMWNESYSIDYDDADYANLSAAVDNKGNILSLGVIRGGEGKRLEKYSSRMFSVDAATKKIVDRELNIDGKYISNAFIRFNPNGDLMITGFYNELTSKGKNEGIEGAFMCIADAKSLDNLDLRIRAIDPSTKAAITRTGALAKLFDADELNAYRIKDIVLRPDGSGYVIAEQFYVQISEDDNSQTRTFYFNHLIVYSFDTNQEISYISTIPKYQQTSVSAPKIGIGPLSFVIWTGSMTRLGYKYNSYIDYEKDGVVYILYNDHRDNGDARSLKEAKVMSNKNKANAVVVAVDANGKWEKEAIFIGKDIDVILETSSSRAIPNEGFIISAERKKDVQYARVKIK